MSHLSSNQFNELKAKATELFESNDNWESVCVCRKEVAGKETGDVCIALQVLNKQPLNEIDELDRFPEFVTLSDGTKVPTDVQITDSLDFYALASCYTLPDPSANPNTWVMPVSGSRSTQRPIQGGLSVGIMPPAGYGGGSVSTGTLGSVAIDLQDGTLVGVSNSHVIAGNTFAGGKVGAYRNSNGLVYWSFLSANDTTPSSGEDEYPVYQQSSYDKFSSTKSVLDPLKIGGVKRAYPFNTSGNKVDVACFAFDDTSLDTSEVVDASTSWKQYLLDYSTPQEWATDAEIDSLLTTESGAPVFRSGRTEGPVGWPGSNPYGGSCALSAYAVSSNANINYSGNLGTISFTNQIYVRGNTDAVTGGDSGSFISALFNASNPALSAWKVIGLVYAGNNSSMSYAICNRITDVANMFSLSAWMGEERPLRYTHKDIQVIESRSTALTAMIGGKMYWQAGSTGFASTTSFDTPPEE